MPARELPKRPPFALRARLLTPLATGGVSHEPDALVDIDAGGRIAWVGPAAKAPRDVLVAAIDIRPWVLLPGMVDTHAHLPQMPNAGVGFALDLLTWLDRLTFPTERSWSDPAVAERLAPAIFEAFAAAGTTTVLAYGVVYQAAMDAAFRAAETHGIRAILGKVMMDRVTYDATIDPKTILKRSLRESGDLIERWHGADHGRLGYAVTPRFAISCSADMLRESASLARSTGTWWQTHLAEDPFEIAEVGRLFPDAIDYVDVYDRAGGLGPRTVLAHAIHLSARELERLVETGTHVAHCAASNLFIGAGVMPLGRYRRANLSIGLGSDVSGGPDASILSVMRVAAYSQMARRSLADDDAAVLTPLDWLRLGTLDGARTLGLDDVIGSLETGKEADLIVVDPAFVMPLGGQPADDDPADLASRLIFRAHPDMVRAAWSRPSIGRSPRRMTAPADLRISGGTVVDGTGAPGRPGTVEVVDGRIRLLEGDAVVATAAARTIDATGKVVAPGFIDLHSHGGLMILADGRHEPKIRQGVTTELVGVDGNGFAPFARRDDLEAFVELDSGLDGRPAIDYDWRSVDGFLARFDGAVSLNVATLIGNSQLRIGALGWDDVPADARALDAMRGLLRDGMAEGVFGLSTGLDYPPGSFATTEELAALTAEAGRHGGFYHTHVRYPLGDRYLDPFREAIEIGRRAGAPAHITHFYHRATYPGGPEPMLALVDDARAEGLDVTFDTYPSEWASTRLLIQLPQWIQAGGPGPLKERLADRTARDRVRAEFTARGASYASAAGWADVRLGAFRRPANLRWESRTVADVMAETGHDALDVICDLLLAEDLGVSQVTSGPSSESLPRFVAHPVGMVGTDSTFLGARPSPRTYGSFPRILGQFVRDEALLSLEEAVRKMTSAPAARLGLRDRGVIRDGAVADLVVFDPATVRSTATYDEPRSHPVGIEHVIVAGTAVVSDGAHTGATPGRGMRHGRD